MKYLAADGIEVCEAGVASDLACESFLGGLLDDLEET